MLEIFKNKYIFNPLVTSQTKQMGQTSTLLPQLFYITTCAVHCDVTEKDLPYPGYTFSEKTQCLLPSSFHSGWCKQLFFVVFVVVIHTHIDIYIIPLGKKFEFLSG